MLLDVLLHTFLLSLVLLGIHGYFGREIIRRGIIFTDLALGQFSALGLAFSLRFTGGAHPYLWAFTGAVLGGILVWWGSRRDHLAEAWIGILYGLGISGAVLLLSGTPGGTEDFLHLTAADLLFTPFRDTLHTGVYYAGIGLLLWLRERYLRGTLRDLAFFVLFAMTITSSVKLAGVLVVFALLLAPALVARLLGRGLLFLWIWGSVVNAVAIGLSFVLDLPTGFTVVFAQALAAAVVFGWKGGSRPVSVET